MSVSKRGPMSLGACGSGELSTNQVIEEIAWIGACWQGVSGSKSPITQADPVAARCDLNRAITAELAAAGFDDAHEVAA